MSAQSMVVCERQPAFLPPPQPANQNYRTTHVVSFIKFLSLTRTEWATISVVIQLLPFIAHILNLF